jgi:hypothetical protein
VEPYALHCLVDPQAFGEGFRIRYHDIVRLGVCDYSTLIKRTCCIILLLYSMYPSLLLEVDYPVSKPKTLVCPPVTQIIDKDNQLLYGGLISALVLPAREPGVVGILKGPGGKIKRLQY